MGKVLVIGAQIPCKAVKINSYIQNFPYLQMLHVV
jgi:hypothetical protein